MQTYASRLDPGLSPSFPVASSLSIKKAFNVQNILKIVKYRNRIHVITFSIPYIYNSQLYALNAHIQYVKPILHYLRFCESAHVPSILYLHVRLQGIVVDF